jgi:hypothetical protein
MLNRLLKGKEFSANKLLKGHFVSLQNDTSSKKSPEVSYLKSPYFNHRERSLPSSQKHGHNLSSQHHLSTDQNINFFESDILELAERIKRP